MNKPNYGDKRDYYPTFDLLRKAEADTECFSCGRPIKKGEYIGLVDNVIFCTKKDCPKATLERYRK